MQTTFQFVNFITKSVCSLNQVYLRSPYANFERSKVVSSKSPFFVINPFCTSCSVSLNISICQSSFVWKYCVFKSSTSTKNGNPVFKKGFHFPENFLQSIKYVQNLLWLPQQNYLISHTESYFNVFIRKRLFSAGFKVRPLRIKALFR